MIRIFGWYLRQRLLGYALFAAGLAYSGFGVAETHVLSDVTPATEAQTITTVSTKTHTVTVRLPGKVIRRVDHILVVRTPRYVFLFHGHRRVLKPKTVHIRFAFPAGSAPPIIAAVIGGSTQDPVTVTVPVIVTEPAVTSTVTLPQDTTTVTVPSTFTTTVTLPLPGDSS
jgi:hypothetical protein